MWRDHPFSKRNRTTERTVGVKVRGDREVGERELDEIRKKRGGCKQYWGVFIKKRDYYVKRL